MEASIDREYYIAAMADKFDCDDDMDMNVFFGVLERALDKTIEEHTTNGNFIVEDWDMFDDDLTINAEKEFKKIYGE
jgi:hypothetical protein